MGATAVQARMDLRGWGIEVANVRDDVKAIALRDAAREIFK